MVRTTLGAEVDTTVTVSGSEQVDFITDRRTDSVASSGSQVVNIRPPPGFIYELLGFRGFALKPSRSGATSGTHELELKSESNSVIMLRFSGTHDSRIKYAKGHIEQANNQAQPPDTVSQTNVIKRLRADAQNGYQFVYRNGTDAATTSRRQIQLWLRKIEVSE